MNQLRLVRYSFLLSHHNTSNFIRNPEHEHQQQQQHEEEGGYGKPMANHDEFGRPQHEGNINKNMKAGAEGDRGKANPPVKPPAATITATTKASSSSSMGGLGGGGIQGAMDNRAKLVGLLLAACIFVTVFYILRRRRKANVGARSFRKGESLVDDEDDLLISQMYR
jgi:hypothetical protein